MHACTRPASPHAHARAFSLPQTGPLLHPPETDDPKKPAAATRPQPPPPAPNRLFHSLVSSPSSDAVSFYDFAVNYDWVLHTFRMYGLNVEVKA